MIVCLLCLNSIDTEDMIILNRSETYHTDCHCKLTRIRENKNKLREDILNVTDSLVFDFSENLINFKNSWDDEQKLIEEQTNFLSDEITLKDFGNLNNNIINELNNIFTGPDYATDIAGNHVKIDKKYVANHKLKSMGIKYKF